MGTLQNHLPFLFLNLQASSGEAKNKSALSLYFNVLAHCKGNLLSTVNSLSCNKSPMYTPYIYCAEALSANAGIWYLLLLSYSFLSKWLMVIRLIALFLAERGFLVIDVVFVVL